MSYWTLNGKILIFIQNHIIPTCMACMSLEYVVWWNCITLLWAINISTTLLQLLNFSNSNDCFFWRWMYFDVMTGLAHTFTKILAVTTFVNVFPGEFFPSPCVRQNPSIWPVSWYSLVSDVNVYFYEEQDPGIQLKIRAESIDCLFWSSR